MPKSYDAFIQHSQCIYIVLKSKVAFLNVQELIFLKRHFLLCCIPSLKMFSAFIYHIWFCAKLRFRHAHLQKKKKKACESVNVVWILSWMWVTKKEIKHSWEEY